MGGRARELLIATGASQAQLADILGCSQAWVSRFLAGKTAISAERLSRLCVVLQCDPALLLQI